MVGLAAGMAVPWLNCLCCFAFREAVLKRKIARMPIIEGHFPGWQPFGAGSATVDHAAGGGFGNMVSE